MSSTYCGAKQIVNNAIWKHKRLVFDGMKSLVSVVELKSEQLKNKRECHQCLRKGHIWCNTSC